VPSENVSTYAAYFAALCTATFEVERERAQRRIIRLLIL